MKRLLMLPALTLALTACGGPGFTNPFSAPLTLQITPGQLTLAPGERRHVSVTASSDGRVIGTPSLNTIDTHGITGVPDETGLMVTVSDKTPEGTYGLVLNGTSGRGSGQAVLNLTVQAPKAGAEQ